MFSRFEIGMLFGLSLMVILMSFSAPVFGLTEQNTTTSEDIPDFNITANRFDFAGGFPQRPGNPSGGEIVNTEGEQSGLGIDMVMVTGSLDGNNNGNELFVQNGGTSSSPEIEVVIMHWDSDTVQWSNRVTLDGVGDTHKYTNETVDLVITLEGSRNTTDADGDGNTQVGAEYTVEKVPTDGGIFTKLPIIGGLASGAGGLAGFVGWIGSVLFYFLLMTGEIVVNLVNVLWGVTSYLFSMVHWMTTTYLGIIQGAPGWVSVFLAVPGILLSGLLAKFVIVAVRVLPTT